MDPLLIIIHLRLNRVFHSRKYFKILRPLLDYLVCQSGQWVILNSEKMALKAICRESQQCNIIYVTNKYPATWKHVTCLAEMSHLRLIRWEVGAKIKRTPRACSCVLNLIFLASTYIIYMGNTWSNIPLVNMDHHSLNWPKKTSTSRIHPTKLTGKLQGGGNEGYWILPLDCLN